MINMAHFKTRKSNNWLFLILLSGIMCSCNARFKVNEEFISTTGKPFPGLTIDKITVIERDESGLPIQYTRDMSVWLITETTKEHSRKIYFRKPNE